MTVYSDGTITLEHGSAEIVGDGTAWETSLIVGGVIYVEAEGGNALPILSVDSDTQITAAIKWMGESGEYSYTLVRDTEDGRQIARNSTALAQILQSLSSPAVGAMSAVTPAAQKLLLFTGPASATTIDLSELIKGIEFDQQVADMDELEALEGVASGKLVLVLDAGDDRSAIFAKIGDEVGVWSEPAYFTGPRGVAGVNQRGGYDEEETYQRNDIVQAGGSTWIALDESTGEAPPTLPDAENDYWKLFARSGTAGVVPRGEYDDEVEYSANDIVLYQGSTWIALQTTEGNEPPTLPTTTNSNWMLLAGRGADGEDGDGTGDVVGPSTATDGGVAVFDGSTGKSLKDAGVSIADIKSSALLQDQKPSGMAGGASVVGWQTRTLNTEVFDPSGIVTLASNLFTVSVNCDCQFTTVAYHETGTNTKARIFNVTDGVAVAYSHTGYVNGNVLTIGGDARLIAGKTYRLDMYVNVAQAVNGLGGSVSDGSAEIYSSVKLRSV